MSVTTSESLVSISSERSSTLATLVPLLDETVFEDDMKYGGGVGVVAVWDDNKKFMQTYASKQVVIHSKPWFTAKHLLLEMHLGQFVPFSIVVAYPEDDFVTDGFVHANNVNCQLIKPLSFMKPPSDPIYNVTSGCHDNVHMIMKQKPVGFATSDMRIYCGVALSVDRLWRMHSWIVVKHTDEMKTTSAATSSTTSITIARPTIVHNCHVLETTESRLLYYGRPCWCKRCSLVQGAKCYNCPETTGTLLCELCGDNPHCDCCGIPCKTCRSEMCLSCMKTHVCQVTV